ncbi:MAG: pteridine reductase [Gammaproteobacteria bacterium]|nr:MAG: pteridine reductase [Gammaproteobacteria bacterium]
MNDKNFSNTDLSNTDLSNKFDGPVALVIGAGHRIGADICRHLHENGYRLIIHCNHSIDQANQLCAELNALRIHGAQAGDSAFVAQADISTEQGRAQLVESVLSVDGKFQGRLDVLINNASAFYPTAVDEVTEQQWQQLFDTNLKAPFFLTQKVAAELKMQSGSVINITDIHGDKPLAGYPVYSMSKAGLISMTRSLARELAPEIRVNAVSPGAILWPEAEKDDHQKQQKIISQIPLNRMGKAHNISQTVLFLLENDYLTGQVINVDGGRG